MSHAVAGVTSSRQPSAALLRIATNGRESLGSDSGLATSCHIAGLSPIMGSII